MNKQGAEQVIETVVFMLLVFLFAAGMYYFVYSQKEGASVQSDFYAKELSQLLNNAHENDQIILDAQSAVAAASKSKITDPKEMFNFDNLNKQVCVKLSPGRKSCYGYFNNVEILNWNIYPGASGAVLIVKVGAKQ